MIKLPLFARVFLAAFVGLLPIGCNSAEQAALLANAPAAISGGLATANDILAALAAANQQLGTQSLNPTTGLAAANAAYGNLASSNLGSAVSQTFAALTNIATSIKASNPAATQTEIAQAQSAQIVATQTQIAAATPAGAATTAMFRVHYNMFANVLVLEKETPQPKA